jgi:hypothetical protein
MAVSPNGREIHVLLLAKQLRCVPGSRWREGMIWIALLPPPIIPILLFFKSTLERKLGYPLSKNLFLYLTYHPKLQSA